MSWKKLVLLLIGLVAIAALVPVSAAAATHYFSRTTTVHGTGTAVCPFGYHVTGGGFDIGAPAIGSSTTGSWVFREVLVSRATKTGWTATAAYTRVKSSGAVSTHRYEPKVYAVCVN